MPRAKAILQSEFPYHISARCINREWFHVPMPEVWRIFCEELTRVAKEERLVIHSFVLMTNHFHLIASTPEANISRCMQLLLRRVSRRLTKAGNRINETFAGRHFKCILQHPTYFLNAYKYNYRNPVTAGICSLVEDYPYSTLAMKLGRIASQIPLCEDATLLSDSIGTLRWLNTAPDPIKANALKNGMRHPYFKSRKDEKNESPLISPADIL